jgi:hypothetical protein
MTQEEIWIFAETLEPPIPQAMSEFAARREIQELHECAVSPEPTAGYRGDRVPAFDRYERQGDSEGARA